MWDHRVRDRVGEGETSSYPPTVPDSDAELYLRLIGEMMLVDRDHENRGTQRPAITEAATTLVAVGVIDGRYAKSVIDDYSLAAALRNDPQFRGRALMGTSSQPDRGDGKPLGPRRVVPCPRTIDQGQARVHVRCISLSEEATSVAVTLRPDPSVACRADRRAQP
ncbi:MAG: hypothetical protein M3065_16665 [Actinomycetota bacterium]|nr:hypothetical protein [Actinomycetota bacterium]